MEESHDDEMNTKLESYIKFLIAKGFIDNEDDQSETIHKFLELYEQFENEGQGVPEDQEADEAGPDPFETRAIFTLADFFKSLGPNEYYDISQKIYNSWEEEQKTTVKRDVNTKLKNLARIMERQALLRKQKALCHWKQMQTLMGLLNQRNALNE